MSEFAGNLTRKFISFRHLGFESSAHNLPEERDSENPQNVAESGEVNTTEAGEAATSPAKGLSSLAEAPMRTKCVGAELGSEDRNLTIAEKDCVLTSSDDDVEDLSAFVAERLQSLSEGSVEKFIEEECVNVEEVLRGNVGVGEEGGGERRSVGQNVPVGGNDDNMRFSPNGGTDRILREDLCNANITLTPKRAARPIYIHQKAQ